MLRSCRTPNQPPISSVSVIAVLAFVPSTHASPAPLGAGSRRRYESPTDAARQAWCGA
jgi:hypothetical protein